MGPKTSLRLIGWPPVKTKVGMCMSPIWSISTLPSAVEGSWGWAMGWAAARQCLQARSQDCVTSQMARKGVSTKLSPPRAGMLCIGCIRPPAESRQNGSCPDGEYGSCTGDGTAWLPKENLNTADEFWQCLGTGKPVKVGQNSSRADQGPFQRATIRD